MASVILGTVGAAAGASVPVVGPLIGRTIGRALGRQLGGGLDNALFGGTTRHREGARLSDLTVQVSTYGRTIPLLYGTMRIAGNILWSRPIAETAATSTSSSGGGKGSSGSVKTSTTTYSYSVSLAIGLCEGPIDGILRVWADAKPLDLSAGTYRLHVGDEAQLPDPYIESFEGIGKTPAYRGQAYVVIEDFPLADYGNRIPNFTFEVQRNVKAPDYQGIATEDRIRSMIMIPGAGEFVYDTSVQYTLPGEAVGTAWAQSGAQVPINMQNPRGVANAVASLDQLQQACPNLEWIGVVATWFGTSLDAGACEVLPGVEYKDGATTTPDVWGVGSYARATAHQVTLEDGRPRYGGTPGDAGLLRFVDEIRRRGLKVLFLPLFFMDVADKPWRGRVTGSASAVASFFTKARGYNAFIMHYANLMHGHVDAFSIGSELVGLTSVAASAGNYPAVSALVSLAASVKAILGSGVTLTYAADWSEYHHTEGGWYHMDPLWASPNIDVIGIDAYFPLTEGPQDGYDVSPVIAGWTSGEGYDYVYDSARTTRSPVAPAYAWKNIDWFWNNAHVNPNGVATAWVPHSKKIWFTEYGFPSVDAATNQPNVFYDPTSSESFFPRDSRGMVDFRAQRLGITATEAKWAGSPMLERRFLWTWDARPFPYFPDLLDVWADGGVWVTGHWTTGKLGLSSLAAIVRELCLKAGLDDASIDVSALGDRVEGYAVTQATDARALIEELRAAYFFDAVESEGVLRFVPRGGAPAAAIAPADLIAESGADILRLTRKQEVELPQKVEVIYLNRTALYHPGTQTASRTIPVGRDAETVNLPVVFTDSEAKSVADATLYSRWTERSIFRFFLGHAFAALEPTDVVALGDGAGQYMLRIVNALADRGRMRIDAVAEDAAVYRSAAPAGATPGLSTPPAAVPATRLDLLDLPSLPGDDAAGGVLRFAAAGLGENWRGAVVYRSDDGGANYARLLDADAPAGIGMAVDALPDFAGGNVFDETHALTVRMLGEGELESVTPLAVFNGANAALLGDEILQFRDAEELSPGRYRLSGLLRGRLGTEWAMASHVSGERFVMIDGRLEKVAANDTLFGLGRLYKGVSVGGTLGGTAEQAFTYTARALKPYAPVALTGSRDGSGNLTLGWTRRTRLSGEWRDGVDVPLGEATEAYQVEIMNGGNVVRLLTAAATQVIYTAAMQATDFGTPPAAVTWRIYQISEKIGRGYPAIATA